MISRLIVLGKEHRQELARFIKFCIVGTIGTAIYFALLNLLYNVLGLPQVFSNIVAMSTSIVNNFLWNRYWVYPELKEQGGTRKFVQFVIVSLIALGLNTAILWTTDRWLLSEAGLLAGLVAPVAQWLGIEHSVLSSNVAAVIATGIVLFWNFFANRLWTFADVDVVDAARRAEAPAEQAREGQPGQT